MLLFDQKGQQTGASLASHCLISPAWKERSEQSQWTTMSFITPNKTREEHMTHSNFSTVSFLQRLLVLTCCVERVLLTLQSHSSSRQYSAFTMTSVDRMWQTWLLKILFVRCTCLYQQCLHTVHIQLPYVNKS